MPQNKKKELSDILDELKKDYLSGFPDKISKLRELTRTESWKELYNEYHKLKGPGKTYGFPEISIICAKMEVLALKPEIQNVSVFEKAADLLNDLRLSYIQEKPLDLNQHPFGKTLLKPGWEK